jgi:hypothetical protein
VTNPINELPFKRASKISLVLAEVLNVRFLARDELLTLPKRRNTAILPIELNIRDQVTEAKRITCPLDFPQTWNGKCRNMAKDSENLVSGESIPPSTRIRPAAHEELNG